MKALELTVEWPVDRVAVGVTNAHETLDVHGPTGAAFPWASVTKLVTAVTVLMAADQDIIALDEQAGPNGATVRHLLAHASGLPLDGTEPVAAPGERRIYSNTGFEKLGDLLPARTRIDMGELVAENVFEPLHMTSARLDGSPAHAASGSVEDLLVLGRELLAPTLLNAELAEEATSVAFPGLSGVLPGFGKQDPNDWGLGFEIRDDKDPHWTGSANAPETFGHFGRSGSFLWVDPLAGLACACLADRDFGDWAVEAWPSLSDRVLDDYA